jgi:hypothetical protein
MVQNRIQRYESIWLNSPKAPSPTQDVIPTGFAVQLLGHLTPEHRQAIAQQRELYQWTFDQARREYDQKLFWDWSI